MSMSMCRCWMFEKNQSKVTVKTRIPNLYRAQSSEPRVVCLLVGIGVLYWYNNPLIIIGEASSLRNKVFHGY
jgi:hypothetical protein